LLTQTSIPGTDDWWLTQLAVEWGKDLPRLGELKRRRDGVAEAPNWGDAAMTNAYSKFVTQRRLNVASLVVEARVNREKPLGFKTAAPGDDDGDSAAMATWNRSNMKVGVRDFLADAATYGSAFLTVTGSAVPGSDGTFAGPAMVPSSGWSTITRQYASRPWLAEAALTVGYDPINRVDILTLFRAGYWRQAFRATRGTSSLPTDGTSWAPGRGWDWVSDPVPLGFTDEVNVVRMDLDGRKGVFERHLDTLRRIDQGILDRITIIAMQAFRQRALKGALPKVYPPEHPQAGQAIDYNKIFEAGPAALWLLGDAEIWESAVTDVTPILEATKSDFRNLAAVTSTPMYILSPEMANGSAEGASLAREALVFSVEADMDRASATFALAHSLAFQAMRDTARADASQIETIWAPADRSSITERASASSQAKAGGLSQRMINEKIFQLSPAEIALERQYKQDEAFDTPVAS
jgi:hypothetical protein